MRLFVFIAILFSFSYNCLAGYIGKELQYNISNTGFSKDIPVIVYFKKSSINNAASLMPKKNSGIKLYKEMRRVKRRSYIESLKTSADDSSRQCKNLLQRYNKSADRDLWAINAIAVRIPSYIISILSNLPEVDRIVYDSTIVLSALPAVSAVKAPLWNLDMIKSPLLLNEGITGAGIVIASMDTGVDGQHPDLISSWRGGTNSWFDPYGQYSSPHDGTGHGTQVMGIILGGALSGDQIGVVPDAKWISVKIFKDDSTSTLSAIHEGFQWLLDPDGDPLTDDAPDIVNNSWGIITQTCDTQFHADIDALKNAGIEVVFSAGNSGSLEKTMYSPADYAQVLSVGAVDQFMNVTSFSSRGPSLCSPGFYPNLMAPGVNLFTSDLSLGLGLTLNPYTASARGTSFSAPHVTGIIALLKSAMPSATNDDIRKALYDSAIDLGVPGEDNVTGHGLVDAYSALLKLRCPAGTADQDGDGWYDECDNCVVQSNKLQLDADADGFGNSCDADLNNDGIVNVRDIIVFKDEFSALSDLIDLDEDGAVSVRDILVFKELFLTSPGPSGLVQ